MGLVFGTAPDSWGVWRPDHPSQPPWPRFLDEAQVAGYRWIELGPFGYLPTDAGRLADELARRELGLLAGTFFGELHRAGERAELRRQAHEIGALVAALGARYMVLMPGGYRGADGAVAGPTDLEPDDWRRLVATVDELGRLVHDEHGLVLTFHPHADSAIEYARQIDRVLDDTDARVVQLCLDTGHVEYRDGDSVALVRERFERIAYLHLKSLDADLRAQVNADDLDFATAVRLGVMCEPQDGVVDFAAIDAALSERAWDGWAIVEQDMFPLTDLERPLPIARRTRHYFHQLGWTT